MKSRLVLVNVLQTSRAFGVGMMTITFPLLAASDGLHAVAIGVLIGLGVLFGAVYTFLFSRGTSRLGVMPFLLLSSLMMTGSAFAYLKMDSITGLLVVAFLGFIPPSAGTYAGALEEGLLAHVPESQRTRTFAVYGMLGTAAGALGALAAGLPHSQGLGLHGSLRALLMLYLGLALVSTMVSLALLVGGQRFNDHPELSVSSSPDRVGLHTSRRIVYKLAALFVADSTGSGMVTAPLIVYWLHVHFSMSAWHLALLVFGMDLLAAVSFPLAERLSRVVGLLNTAVFTHIPSSMLLMAVPFSPSGTVAAALLLTRGLLVEMDVPTRQSYLASVVQPEERVQAAGVTSMGKQLGRAMGPVGGGWMLTAFGALGPFVGGGALKIAYDVTLWLAFRSVKPVEVPHSGG